MERKTKPEKNKKRTELPLMGKQATDFSSVLRFANTITYSNEYNFCDCLRPRATRHELVDMSQTEGLTQHLVPSK